jgi:transcriptional regulator with XRE-family HTH domain
MSVELTVEVGTRLQWLRDSFNHNQNQWANALALTPQMLNKWERGTRAPNLDKLISICEATGCTMDYLFRARVGLDVRKELRDWLWENHRLELVFVDYDALRPPGSPAPVAARPRPRKSRAGPSASTS